MLRIFSLTLVAVLVAVAVVAYSPREDPKLATAAARVEDLNRMTTKPFKMETIVARFCRSATDADPHQPHSDYFCHVFVTKEAVDIINSGEGTYPVGTIIVKQKFSDAAATKTELFTLMRKQEAGYDPEQGDWEYSIVDKSAQTVLARGRIESCIACHDAYKETDYVTRIYMPTRDETRDDGGNNSAPRKNARD